MTRKKKVLFTSHTANFSKFNRPFMRWFHDQGWEVHYASAGEEDVLDCDRHFTIPFDRSPWSLKNINACKQLKAIINKESYDLIHTHTPMGSVVTRLAARPARKRGTKVIYTAHGFHFYSGAPVINWLIYYPVEKMLARDVDALITINSEDYAYAKAKLDVKKVEKINGVGVDLSRFVPVGGADKATLRKKLGYKKDDKILLSVAEFTTNKNQMFLINAMKELIEIFPNIKLILAGVGYRLDPCKALASRLGLEDNVKFVGYVNNVNEFNNIADLLVSSSAREGLPVNIIEGMACGIPVVCTSVRGHIDLITNEVNGLLYQYNDMKGYIRSIEYLLNDKKKYKNMSENNISDSKKYSLKQAIATVELVYEDILK